MVTQIWAHFTKILSMVIKVWWVFHSALVGSVFKLNTMNFCTWHNKCIDQFSTEFESLRKIFREMGPWFNIGSGNGLFPDDTKQLAEQMLTPQWWVFLAFTGVMGEHNLHYSTNLFG